MRASRARSFFESQNQAFAQAVVIEGEDKSMGELLQLVAEPLFGSRPPAVRARFFLEGAEMGESLLRALTSLHALPIPIVCEEQAISAPLKRLLGKASIPLEEVGGGVERKIPNIFSITTLFASGKKKELWMAYHELLPFHAPEAIFGVLLWKARQLAQAGGPEATRALSLYRTLLETQARARTTKLPFDMALERALLTLG